jgi:hypothetical protein
MPQQIVEGIGGASPIGVEGNSQEGATRGRRIERDLIAAGSGRNGPGPIHHPVQEAGKTSSVDQPGAGREHVGRGIFSRPSIPLGIFEGVR